MKWNSLQSIDQINTLKELSHQTPVLIFKHSTRCSISTIAKQRLVSEWKLLESKVEPFYLDLIAFRDISDHISEIFAVHHESPQVLLLKNGECTYETSHLDIHANEIHEALSYTSF